MSTNPEAEPELPTPQAPPETPPTPPERREPVPERPDEIEPVTPDIDRPDRSPDETPPDLVSDNG